MNLKKRNDEWLSRELETELFEDILERFDLTPQEVFQILFDQGLIDSELMNDDYDFDS